MSTQTLLFEEIPKTTSVTNKDSIGNFPGGHNNAYGWQTAVIFQKGRYNQTEGNMMGDNLPSVPACPYHMPRNSSRFNDPRLNVLSKKVGDPIHATDINNLIDKIKAFQYIWEAEANNIYGYPILPSPNNVSVNTNNLNYINVIDGDNSKSIINKNPIIDGGNTTIIIPKEEHFLTSSNFATKDLAQNEIITNRANKIKSHVKYNNQLPCSFPEYLDNVNVNDLTNFGLNADSGLGLEVVWNPNVIINSGHENMVSVKTVQYLIGDKISPNFKLMYISGNNKGKMVKDNNDVDIIFLANVEYIVSHRKDNQPDTNLTFSAFGLYYLSPVINTAPGSTITIETYTNPEKVISKERSYTISNVFEQQRVNESVFTDTQVTMTPELIIDVKDMFDIYCTSLYNNFYHQIDSAAYKTWLRSLTNYKITIPAQKVENGKYYYKNPGTSAWIESNGIYSLFRLYPEKRSDITYTNTTPPVKVEKNLQYGIGVEFYVNRPLHNERYIMDSNYITTVVLNSDGTRSHSDLLFADFIDFCKAMFIPTIKPMMSDYVLFPVNNFGAVFINEKWQHIIPYKLTPTQLADLSPTALESYQSNFIGVQLYKDYFLDYGCPLDSTLINGRCRTLTEVDATVIGGVTGETINELIFSESDITYIKPRNLIGTGSYPIIKGTDFLSVRNVLKNYLNSVLALSQISISANGSDAQTSMEINTFLTNQANVSDTFDPNDPEITFLGYHAFSKGIIKVDFYNILVDAYKLLINSCVCNADCSCNLVCVCNTNCGCNYSW